MTTFDWTLVAVYFVLSLGIGVFFTRRAGRNLEEFFLSGRNLPWWLAGTAMVATTFAADTPLAVTELVAQNGIAGNWLWWNFAFGGVLTVFFFARLWRRAGVLTDIEFIELRYSGKPAAFLRGFRALYLGVFINSVILAWVNLAMATVLEGMFGIPRDQVLFYVGLALLVTAAYSALAGLWGVTVADAFQFLLAMTGTVALAVIVLELPEVGGVSGLRDQVPAWVLRLTPSIGEGDMGSLANGFALTLTAFLAYVGVQWWASWYPGAEPGGGGYVAQRMMSAKNERHSLFATLWFTIAHYCVRPWPWILVALATLVLYPELGPEERRLGFILAMRDFLPSGLKGILVAAFFAAYMSTVSTHLNWGSSYVVNDLYHRFVRAGARQKELVAVSRGTTIILMILSLGVTAVLPTIKSAWEFIIEAGAGLGLVLILRWFWWRINAWSEIAAMLAALGAYSFVRFFLRVPFPYSLYPIVALTTVTWLLVTWMTRPTEPYVLASFYRRIRPGGPGWRCVAQAAPDVRSDMSLGRLALSWVWGVLLVYSTLFATGRIIFGEYAQGALFLLMAVLTASLLYRDLAPRRESA